MPAHMNTKRTVAVVVVVAAALAIVVWQRKRATRASGEVANKALDYRLSPVLSAYQAPEGSTPCETAYNACAALDRGAKERGGPTPWTALPDRATFLTRCAALPAQEQQCLQPRYAAEHHDPCEAAVRRIRKTNAVFESNPSVPLD